MVTQYPTVLDNINSLPDVGTGLDPPLLLLSQQVRTALIAIETQLGVQQGGQSNMIGVIGTQANQIQALTTSLATLNTLVNKIITLNGLKTS